MSSEGGLVREKHGGSHEETHGSQLHVNIDLVDTFSIKNEILSDSHLSEQDKTIQNGAGDIENKNVTEDNLHFLSSDVDLDSYERAVVENNAEWLKSRCRNIETVDFDIPTSAQDVSEVGDLFRLGDPLPDDSVIPLCSEGSVLTSANDLFNSNSRSVCETPSSITSIDATQSHVDELANTGISLDQKLVQKKNFSLVKLENDKNNTLMTPQELESMPDRGLEFEESVGPKTSNDTLVSLFLQDSTSPTGKVELEAAKGMKLPVSTNTYRSSELGEVGPSPATPASSSMAPAVQVLPPVIVPSTTVTQTVIKSTPDAHLAPQGNLKLATISISTDKVANSTQILVNTNQGQQLYHINTADLTQATSALEPLSRPMNGVPMKSVLPGESQPLAVQTGYLILPTPVAAPTEQHGGSVPVIMSVPVDTTHGTAIIQQQRTVPQKAKRVYLCTEPGCDKVFSKLSKMKIHLMRHTGERPFKCNVPGCDWAFTTFYKLKRHEEFHKGRRDFVCDFKGCGKKFTTSYNLNSHKKLHERPCIEECPTPGCGQKFPTKRQLDLHMKSHAGLQKTYKCPFKGCDKTFFSPHYMGSHPRVHLQEQDLKCKFPGCDKVFDKACRLKQHMRSHTGEKPYVCYYEGCGWAFTTASKLKRHQAKHTGLRKWKCEHCGRAFMRSEHLKGHMITHSGNKPYACPVEGCQVRFTAKSSLYVHMKRHESQKEEKITYHCPIEGCMKKYTLKSKLRQHMVKQHLSYMSEGDGQVQIAELDLGPLLNGELQDLGIPPQVTRDSSLTTPTTEADVAVTSLPNATAVEEIPATVVDPLEFIANPDIDDQQSTSITLSAEDMSQINPSVLNQLMSSLDKNDPADGKKEEITGATEVLHPDNITHITSQVENSSGSARTDYLSNYTLSHRAKQRRRILKDKSASVTLDSASFQDPSEESFLVPTSSVSYSPPEPLTSCGITFRDPETGVTYIQTQLLQDDPPSTVTDLYTDESVLSSELSELQDTASNNLHHSIHDTEFSGSTINLQDLQ